MISLQIICKGTKDEIDSIKELLDDATGCVDHIYLTVTHDKGIKPIEKLTAQYDDVTTSFFKWTNRFDEARNFNYAQSKHDYKMWIDVGDKFNFNLIKNLDLTQADAFWFPYEYAFDDKGNCIAEHWRERITSSKIPFTWRGWVHETLITEIPHKTKRLNYPVIHKKQDKEGSLKRNHEILVEAYKQTHDPRYIHYLGLSYYTLKQWQNAIDTFEEYLKVGGWDEEMYRSLLRMSEAASQLDKIEDSQNYALKAVGLMPHYPWGYYNLAELEFQDDNWKECLEWLNVAFAKPQPESASIHDPTVQEKAKMMAAACKFMLGDARTAVQILEKVIGEDVGDLLPLYQLEAAREVQSVLLQELAPTLPNKEAVWKQLPDDFKYDSKFRKVRELYTKPSIWPEKSIVFFCGKGYEEWGPHTIDKGMGGSEEAIIYLAPELVKQGYHVTVYGEVPEPYEADGVEWYPWKQIDRRDRFDTLVVWRNPAYAPQFTAKRVLIDIHDLLPEKLFKNYPNAHYMFKSQFHADKHELDNFSIISNGIKEEY